MWGTNEIVMKFQGDLCRNEDFIARNADRSYTPTYAQRAATFSHSVFLAKYSSVSDATPGLIRMVIQLKVDGIES